MEKNKLYFVIFFIFMNISHVYPKKNSDLHEATQKARSGKHSFSKYWCEEIEPLDLNKRNNIDVASRSRTKRLEAKKEELKDKKFFETIFNKKTQKGLLFSFPAFVAIVAGGVINYRYAYLGYTNETFSIRNTLLSGAALLGGGFLTVLGTPYFCRGINYTWNGLWLKAFIDKKLKDSKSLDNFVVEANQNLKARMDEAKAFYQQ